MLKKTFKDEYVAALSRCDDTLRLDFPFLVYRVMIMLFVITICIEYLTNIPATFFETIIGLIKSAHHEQFYQTRDRFLKTTERSVLCVVVVFLVHVVFCLMCEKTRKKTNNNEEVQKEEKKRKSTRKKEREEITKKFGDACFCFLD